MGIQAELKKRGAFWNRSGRQTAAVATAIVVTRAHRLPRWIPPVTWDRFFVSGCTAVLALGLLCQTKGGSHVDAVIAGTIQECLIALVVLPAVIPWRYVRSNYMSKRGDRWFERRSFYRAPDSPPHHNH